MSQSIADRITVEQAMAAIAWLESIAAIFNDALDPTDESMRDLFDKVCALKEKASADSECYGHPVRIRDLAIGDFFKGPLGTVIERLPRIDDEHVGNIYSDGVYYHLDDLVYRAPMPPLVKEEK